MDRPAAPKSRQIYYGFAGIAGEGRQKCIPQIRGNGVCSISCCKKTTDKVIKMNKSRELLYVLAVIGAVIVGYSVEVAVLVAA
jgi:hypothetical protein